MLRQVTVLVNGEPEAHVQVNDRGFLYGDGIFETMAISQGAPPLEGKFNLVGMSLASICLAGIVTVLGAFLFKVLQ